MSDTRSRPPAPALFDGLRDFGIAPERPEEPRRSRVRPDPASSLGGAIADCGGDVVVTDSTFSDNGSDGLGGAILSNGGIAVTTISSALVSAGCWALACQVPSSKRWASS